MEVGDHPSLVTAHAHLLIAAIHKIFAANTKRFPDMKCVIGTKKSLPAVQRTFTYRQFN
jgi:hypothetical protein